MRSMMTLSALLALSALVGCDTQMGQNIEEELEQNTPELSGEFAAPGEFCQEFPQYCDSEDTGDNNDFELAPIEDLPEQNSQPTLYVTFEITGHQQIDAGDVGVHMGNLTFTAEGGDIPLRGMILQALVDANGDGFFSNIAEVYDGNTFWAQEYLESVYLINVETVLVEFGFANVNNNGLISLFETEPLVIEDGEQLELRIFGNFYSDVDVLEDLAFAVDLTSPDNVWVEGDVEVVVENGQGNEPTSYVFF